VTLLPALSPKKREKGLSTHTVFFRLSGSLESEAEWLHWTSHGSGKNGHFGIDFAALSGQKGQKWAKIGVLLLLVS
jgi:hypothetical protein